MSEFTTTVTEFTERSGDYFTATPAKALAGIIVRPPITSGKLFRDAILGREGHLVNVQEVVTTPDASVFIAESGNAAEVRETDIRTIAERIGRLANEPESIVQMIDENPFPQPQEQWA